MVGETKAHTRFLSQFCPYHVSPLKPSLFPSLPPSLLSTTHPQPVEDLVLEGTHKSLLRVRANTPYRLGGREGGMGGEEGGKERGRKRRKGGKEGGKEKREGKEKG